MADGHLAVTPGTGDIIDTDPAFTNSEGVAAKRSRVHAYSAAGDQADLATLVARILAGTADAAAPGELGLAGYNGVTWDRLRTLAASGYGLGVLKQSGATNERSGSASPRDTTPVTLIPEGSTVGVKKRTLGVVSTLDHDGILSFQIGLTLFGLLTVLSFVVPAASGATTITVLDSDNLVITVSGTAITLSTGTAASLGMAGMTCGVSFTASVAPTAGSIYADLVEQT